ncbi:MAG: helix-turn-helix domain-containing protein [Parabacteroides sp.]
MEIKDLVNQNMQVVLNATDLKEFGLSLVQEVLTGQKVKEPEKYLSTKEAARFLDIDPSTLWKWGKAGYLVPIRVGGKKRYKLSDIKKIYEGC